MPVVPDQSDQSRQVGSRKRTPARVLLVEDDSLYRQTLKDLISIGRELFDIEEAESIAEGLDRLSRGGIDLVLLDLSLPDSHGMLTLARIRNKVPNIPIIVLTACDDDEIALETLQKGAQDYLVKDQIDRHLLVRSMRYAMERKRTEERLHEQVELLNAARDAIVVQNLEGRILFWNRAAERIYGWTEEDVLGVHIRDLVGEENLRKWRGAWDNIRRSVIKHGEWMGELENPTKDGRSIIVECRCSLMRDEEGSPKSVLLINTDISEKKKLEAQFLRMQRMESVGAMASGIAHDLNNWLSPILTSIHTLQQRFTDPNSQKWLSLIRKSAERSRDLVDQVLTFARGKGGERLALNTANLIADVSKIISETLPRQIALRIDLASDLWSVMGDATQLHQVLMNLCINARDAMPEGGTLAIAAANVDLTEDDVWMINEVEAGRYVRISVIDSGVGMSQETIDHAFEPFYTTKEHGLGTGLGLSITLGIVRSHGGFINVKSAVGNGSQFNIYLPAGDAAPERIAPVVEEKAPTGHGELLLVVDDENEVREITVATLESCGYRALGAASSQEALALCAAHDPDVKLILADLALPALDAGFFENRLLRRVRIIGTSGLRSQEKMDLARRAGIDTILWKPYTAQDLLVAIEQDLKRH